MSRKCIVPSTFMVLVSVARTIAYIQASPSIIVDYDEEYTVTSHYSGKSSSLILRATVKVSVSKLKKPLYTTSRPWQFTIQVHNTLARQDISKMCLQYKSWNSWPSAVKPLVTNLIGFLWPHSQIEPAIADISESPRLAEVEFLSKSFGKWRARRCCVFSRDALLI